MTVRLIAKTVPAIDLPNADDIVSYTARVSNPANQMNHETAPKLLNYLQKNQHWSPFEMASATLEIVTSRDIARQILRHRSFSFQEFSQRYAQANVFYGTREFRLQDDKNRQNSIEITDGEYGLEKADWYQAQSQVWNLAETVYRQAIKNGVAKEVARSVLPEGLTESTLYMAGTLRSWKHYIDLRTDNGTQKEHRRIAEECREVLKEAYPNIFG